MVNVNPDDAPFMELAPTKSMLIEDNTSSQRSTWTGIDPSSVSDKDHFINSSDIEVVASESKAGVLDISSFPSKPRGNPKIAFSILILLKAVSFQ